MWFTAEPKRLQQLVASPNSTGGMHRVCYSFHSSYSEVRDLVSLLQPRQVFPNVLPASDSTFKQVIMKVVICVWVCLQVFMCVFCLFVSVYV